MAYVRKPGPPDEEVIFTDHEGNDYTWGQHRQMEKWLKEAEEDDPLVKEARQRLDAALEEVGFQVNDDIIFWCQWCKQEETRPHLQTCPDWEPPPTREAAAYRYRDASFNIIHTTSVPMTNQEALEYFSVVAVWFDKPPTYVESREFDSSKFTMLPFVYDADTREVTKLENSEESGTVA